MKPILRTAADLEPAAYNPREADEKRLALVHLSLRKLGWLLPIYASGTEILSGHQRHLVATERWGARRVPVVDLGDRDETDRRLINIAFNRGTNDLRVSDSSRTLTEDIFAVDLEAVAADFPDLDPDSEEAWPCLRARPIPIAELVPSCEGRWSDHAARLAHLMAEKGVRMPVIVAGARVVNGIGRVQAAAERGESTVECVEIEPAKAHLAENLLNRLTMDFTVHKRYADLLRFSNSRRGRSPEKLNLGMLYPLGMITKEFDPKDPAHQKKWKRFFGETVLDFGAGSGTDTRLLRSMGVDSTPFEPWAYTLARDESLDMIDPEESRRRVREFLARVPTTRWNSVFLCSVFNSVPFDADRRHIVALIAALAPAPTMVFPCAASHRNGIMRHVEGREFLSDFMNDRLSFPLDYEPRIVMTSFDLAAKTQRYFTPQEFYDLWAERFVQVRAIEKGGLVRAWVREPRPLPWERLEEAIAFEFDLPYPDGSRMGLVDEAIAAFRARRAHFG